MRLGVRIETDDLDGPLIRCAAKGRSGVSLPFPQVEILESGDFVRLHFGHAVQKTSPEDGRFAWELIDPMLQRKLEDANA